MPKHFAREAKPLAGRSRKQKVDARPVYIPRPPLLYVPQLDSSWEIELRLSDSVLVYLACVVGRYLYAELALRELPAAHAVKER